MRTLNVEKIFLQVFRLFYILINKIIKLNRIILTIVTLLFSISALANMASPIIRGTQSSSVISSKDVDVINETIDIHIDSAFKNAKFSIEYTINCKVAGTQMPLLFYAKNYKDGFKVWLDGTPVNIEDLKNENGDNINSLPYIQRYVDEDNNVNVKWNKNANESDTYNKEDLKFFIANISSGEHKIHVEYNAQYWIDKSDWVREYSFRYSLEPSFYWHSFKNISISITQDNPLNHYTTNLGEPNKGKTWFFEKIPSSEIKISYKPEISSYAKFLLAISPEGIWFFSTLLLIALHLAWVILYRKNNPKNKVHLIAILGSFIIPFLSITTYIFSFFMINNAIGIHASGTKGYMSILAYVFYPFFIIIYGIIVWIIDWLYKRKLNTNGN